MGWCPVKISCLDFGLHPGVGRGAGLAHERSWLLVVLLRDANQVKYAFEPSDLTGRTLSQFQ